MQLPGENGGGGERGPEAGGDFASGAGEQGQTNALGFGAHADGGDGGSNDCIGEPDAEPRGGMMGGEPGGEQSGGTDDDLAASGDRSEGRGACDGFANEAKVVGRLGWERLKMAGTANAMLAGVAHEGHSVIAGKRCQVLCDAESMD